MAEQTGVVQDIKSKQVAGGKTAYDLVVAGQAYGVGLYAPKCKVGDYVKFEVDESRGYKNVARNSLQVSANKAPAEAVAVAAATKGGFDNRQDTISRQAAMNTAIAFMTILSDNEGLGLPAATAKGKRAETLELMLKKYTADFYEFNTGVAFKDVSPKKKAAAAEEAEEVEADAEESWQ